VANELNRVELRLNADERFLPGLVSAVAHFAERVGLDPTAQTRFVTAAEDAFAALLPLLSPPEAMFGIIVEDFPDRVEVIFEHEGRPWSAGAEKAFAQVDRAKQESSGKFYRLILTQFVRPSA
jgi:hypothetical protein